jgi:hypothetical protein
MKIRAWLRCIVLVTSILAPAVAAAQADPKARGDRAMDEGRFADALAAYDEAAAANPGAPTILYNRGRALEHLGRHAEAYDALVRFRASAPADLLAKVPGLDRLIAEIRAKVALITVRADVAGAEVFVRGRSAFRTPREGPIAVDPGPVAIEIRAPKHAPYSKTLEVAPGETHVVDAVLRPEAALGALRVRPDVPTATVQIDGRPVAPSTAVPLSEGRHEVVVREPGHEERRLEAFVQAGATTDVDVTLRRDPGLTSRWPFWVAVGAVVVGATVTTIVLLSERSADRGNVDPGRVAAPLIRF